MSEEKDHKSKYLSCTVGQTLVLQFLSQVQTNAGTLFLKLELSSFLKMIRIDEGIIQL